MKFRFDMTNLGDRHTRDWDGEYNDLTPIPRMTLHNSKGHPRKLSPVDFRQLKHDGRLWEIYPDAPSEFKSDVDTDD